MRREEWEKEKSKRRKCDREKGETKRSSPYMYRLAFILLLLLLMF